MKVKELIEQLNKFDSETEILINSRGNTFHEIFSVTQINVKRNDNYNYCFEECDNGDGIRAIVIEN